MIKAVDAKTVKAWLADTSELAFLDVHFPDLSTADLDAVFADYAKRDRRYGGVQVTSEAVTETVTAAARVARHADVA